MAWFKYCKTGNLYEASLFGVNFFYVTKAKMPPHIDKNELNLKIHTLNENGITSVKRPVRIIVSLTSFPERIHNDVIYTLYSLLTQDFKPDEIILWLAKEQFPDGLNELPKDILALQKIGLSIKWCDDLRSYKKLIPALQEFPKDIIVTADDDIYYPKDWLERLYHAHLKNPDCIIGHRLHRITLDKQGMPLPYKKWRRNVTCLRTSFRNFLTTGGGVLYPPHSLYKDACRNDLFRSMAPYADDIWFWAMAVLNDSKIKTFYERQRKIVLVNPEREMRQTDEFTLAKVNITQVGNDKQMREVIKHYPELLEKLKFD